MEETGYAASRMSLLLQCPSSSGMSDEIVTFFLAEGLRKVGPGGGDESEDILVHAVSRADALQLVAEDRIPNGHTLIALQWLQIHGDALRERWC